MAWAAALFDQGQLTSADQWFLTAINSWLSNRRGMPVPLRERSLEIFHDEKLLETRISGPLFSPTRLTLDLLQSYLCWPPVERLDCGPGDWLIVENYTTYHSLARRARELGFDGRSSGAPERRHNPTGRTSDRTEPSAAAVLLRRH